MSERNSECVNVENDPTFRQVEDPQLSQSRTRSKLAQKPKIQKSYRKKVESEWSHEKILKLVQEIEIRRGLWDAGCPEYKLPKEALWQEVADAIHVTLNDCKGKWSNLRISFKSNLDKYRKKKSDQDVSGSVQITWKYFKPMMFLEANKVLQSTKWTSSMELKSALNDQTLLVDFGERSTQEFVLPSPLTPGTRRKRMLTTSRPSPSSSDTSQNSSLKQMAVEALQFIRSAGSQPKNASTALCDYMASELQNLTPEQSAFARSKLRRAFNDIMEEAALLATETADNGETANKIVKTELISI